MDEEEAERMREAPRMSRKAGKTKCQKQEQGGEKRKKVNTFITLL